MSVTSPAKSQVIAIESVPRPQYSYAALAFMQITAGGSAGNFDCSTFALSLCSLFCCKVHLCSESGVKQHTAKHRT